MFARQEQWGWLVDWRVAQQIGSVDQTDANNRFGDLPAV